MLQLEHSIIAHFIFLLLFNKIILSDFFKMSNESNFNQDFSELLLSAKCKKGVISKVVHAKDTGRLVFLKMGTSTPPYTFQKQSISESLHAH